MAVRTWSDAVFTTVSAVTSAPSRVHSKNTYPSQLAVGSSPYTESYVAGRVVPNVPSSPSTTLPAASNVTSYSFATHRATSV